MPENHVRLALTREQADQVLTAVDHEDDSVTFQGSINGQPVAVRIAAAPQPQEYYPGAPGWTTGDLAEVAQGRTHVLLTFTGGRFLARTLDGNVDGDVDLGREAEFGTGATVDEAVGHMIEAYHAPLASPEEFTARFAALSRSSRGVLEVCLAEAEANRDHSDVHTAVDIAADIQRVLGRVYLNQE